MIYKKLHILLSVLMLTSFELLSQDEWKIDKRKEGIIVYTKAEKGSEFKSFKAVAEVGASPKEIIEVLKNANKYTEWYGYTKTSSVLKREESVQYNYVETIFPWPYSNRDMVYKMSLDTMDPKALIISLKGIPDYIPEKKGIVRMVKAEGQIQLQVKGNTTEIIYIFHSEPGNGISPWLANKSIAELPYKTLLGLRKILSERVKNNN